jgi:adenine-specific DNA methylase
MLHLLCWLGLHRYDYHFITDDKGYIIGVKAITCCRCGLTKTYNMDGDWIATYKGESK